MTCLIILDPLTLHGKLCCSTFLPLLCAEAPILTLVMMMMMLARALRLLLLVANYKLTTTTAPFLVLVHQSFPIHIGTHTLNIVAAA